VTSTRVKQVSHPAPSVWMHHIQLHSTAEVDEEVLGLPREAFLAAG
jgi:hypothetical protein